jgi:type IV/VI secretion system ImpK/VasF family protein
MSTRLIDLCEPLFQAVCRLNRMGRKGSSTDYPTARSEILTLFERMQQEAKGDLALSEQFRKVEMPLIFFVDSMIAESTLRFAAEWNRNRMAYERNELAGDEKFFDLLDETLKETRDGADERLAVFYTCMGLGFAGWYSGQPEYLRKKMMEIAPRVRAYVDADETGLITPDSYQHTNTTNLPMPMAASLVPLLIILGGLFLVVSGVNIYSFRSASKELNEALDAIAERGPERASANASR